MALRAGLINGNSITQDYDFWYLLKTLVPSGWINVWFDVATWVVNVWNCFIPCERTNGNMPFVFVELTSSQVIDTTWTKKVWIEISQAKIDDWATNNEDWTGIAEIKTWASYPLKNFLPLASITGGTITDERVMIEIDSTKIPRPAFNQSIKDLNDVYAFANPTVKKFLVRDEVEQYRTVWEIETSDIPSDNVKQLVLGENISSAWVVSIMPDWKAYKLSNNKRLMSNGTITGQTNTRSCLFSGWTKIATVWQAWTTMTIRIWTIDYWANSITYWTPVTVTSTEWTTTSFTICSLWTDKVAVTYKANSPANIYCRAISVSWTVPTIWAISTAVSWWTLYRDSIYVADDLFMISHSASFVYARLVSVSWTTISFWSDMWFPEYSWWYVWTLRYCRHDDTHILFGYWWHWTSHSWYDMTNLYCASISWTTMTLWAWVNINNSYNVAATPVSDWTNIYYTAWSSVNTTYKFSLSWTTLTQVFATWSMSGETILLSGWMIWLLSAQTVAWYSIWASAFVARNSINYWITPLFNDRYSTNYFFVTVSWNPSYIHKISNENRNICWYLKSTWNLGDTRDVFLDSALITGLTDVVPWMPYYLSYTDWSIWASWDLLFGKWISTTEIKESIWAIA